MVDRPMGFKAPMILALAAGRKTQTRRIVKWLDGNLEPKAQHAVGDRLWVREGLCQCGSAVAYRADDIVHGDAEWVWKRRTLPSIHMPKGLSRFTLTVTNVLVHRLQDITEADAKAEGCGLYVADHGWITEDELRADPGYSNFICARHGFEDVWRTIHGKDSWYVNPWVAAYTFTVERRA